MIEEHVNIHDNFSLEMKVGFTTREKREENDFSMDMWVFIPNPLDINKYTYSKSDFYRDVKSNVRLITPIYLLKDIARPEELPLRLLTESLRKIADHTANPNVSEYETHIKMFQAILKSSLREDLLRIESCEQESEQLSLVKAYIGNVSRIAAEYRKLRRIIEPPATEKNVFEYYLFGDEFMSDLIELHTFKLLKSLDKNSAGVYARIKTDLLNLIHAEIGYKKANAYPVIERESPTKNQDIISRFGTLKRYMESQLFLKVKIREDGAFVRQFYYSLAAGISMIFATVIAFSFQLKYGNFTLPLFIAMVVGYMLKDRIKELSRYYFSHRLDSKYFDNKTDISFSNAPIGWYKESQSFVKEMQLPAEVMQLRNRSAILEAENRNNDEKIILYRLRMQLSRKDINQSNIYPVAGVNNILRFNLFQFIRKMDNPEVPLFVPGVENDYEIIQGEKIYYLNFILRYEYLDQLELKRYRITFNREGIKQLEQF